MDIKDKAPQAGGEFTLLVTAGDTVEAGIIESKLNAGGIKTVRKYREPGAYLNVILGNTIMGVDILVEEDKLEEARIILESAQEVSDEDILADESFSDETVKTKNEENLKKLSLYAWIIMAVFLIIIAAAVIIYIL
jgi:hypothetical protein